MRFPSTFYGKNRFIQQTLFSQREAAVASKDGLHEMLTMHFHLQYFPHMLAIYVLETTEDAKQHYVFTARHLLFLK